MTVFRALIVSIGFILSDFCCSTVGNIEFLRGYILIVLGDDDTTERDTKKEDSDQGYNTSPDCSVSFGNMLILPDYNIRFGSFFDIKPCVFELLAGVFLSLTDTLPPADLDIFKELFLSMHALKLNKSYNSLSLCGPHIFL